MKTYAVGDIHGAYKALIQCFKRSKFDYRKDRLIVMGDVCDGYPEIKQCIDELLKIKHCDLVIGNHDMWALNWALKGDMPEIWTKQGGDRTMASYNGGPMPQAHIDFLKGGQLWIECDEQIFMHGVLIRMYRLKAIAHKRWSGIEPFLIWHGRSIYLAVNAN